MGLSPSLAPSAACHMLGFQVEEGSSFGFTPVVSALLSLSQAKQSPARKWSEQVSIWCGPGLDPESDELVHALPSCQVGRRAAHSERTLYQVTGRGHCIRARR